MHPRILCCCLALCLAQVACVLRQPPAAGDILTEKARGQIPGQWGGAHARGGVVPGWIRSFDDPELTRMVGDAVARNPDLRAAEARVEASRAAVRVAAASLYPRVALKGLGERQGREMSGALGLGINPASLGSLGVDVSGGDSDLRSAEESTARWNSGIGIGAAWEADVWGRIRARKAAARAESGSLEADYEYARQSLAAQVARAYFSVIEASQQAANARESLDLYKEYLKLTEARKGQGFASDFDLAQVRAKTAGVEDTLYAAEAARAQAVRAIEVVTSTYPTGKREARATFPVAPRGVPAGLPSQLLERRPDIVAAERRFAAAFHRVHEARTARLPRFALSVAGGLGSAQLDGVGVLESLSWSLAAGVVQPIFFGGELKAAQDIRTSEQKAAAAEYTSAALRAFQDVEDALDSEYHLRRRETALTEMVNSSAQAVKLGRAQLEQGQVDMFTILRLAAENLAAKIELTKVRASRLRERANLHLALGGGFEG